MCVCEIELERILIKILFPDFNQFLDLRANDIRYIISFFDLINCDGHGVFVAAATCSIPNHICVDEGEVMRLHEALLWIKEVEMYYKVVVDVVNSEFVVTFSWLTLIFLLFFVVKHSGSFFVRASCSI